MKRPQTTTRYVCVVCKQDMDLDIGARALLCSAKCAKEYDRMNDRAVV